ncbi:hypothetical protein [Bosea sp. Root381]|uniref:hypothetical protein n=1 Tax=Bosea sp. Root381 TaxID=1736524 RepID=UPI001FCD4C38|nr:hypothetical protein [Bosea sp. Root381]
MLQFEGKQPLALLGFLEDGDIPGYRQDRLRLAVRAYDGRDLDIPEAGGARCRLGGTLETKAAPGARFLECEFRVDVALIGPEIRPGAPLDRIEVADLHDSLSTFAHEGELAVQINDLDAIVGRRQQATHEAGVTKFLRCQNGSDLSRDRAVPGIAVMACGACAT